MSFLNRTKVNGAGSACLALGSSVLPPLNPPPNVNVPLDVACAMSSSSALSLAAPLQGVLGCFLKERGAYFSSSSQKSSTWHFCFVLVCFFFSFCPHCNALAIQDQKLSKIIKMGQGRPKTECLPGARFW